MISFATLSNNYGIAAPSGFLGFMQQHGISSPNTCAVRLSYAIFLSDSNFFADVKARSGVEWYGLPTRANDLAIILNKKIKNAVLVTSEASISGKTGIIFFDTIVGFGGTGHISLWNGTAVSDNGNYFNNSPRVYFWSMN